MINRLTCDPTITTAALFLYPGEVREPDNSKNANPLCVDTGGTFLTRRYDGGELGE